MKLLTDNALSPIVSSDLALAGHDCIHVRDRRLQSAPDVAVFALAEAEDRVIISADTDFGALLAVRKVSKPSFILLPKTSGLKPRTIAAIPISLLDDYRDELAQGCILTITDETARIRKLPIV